jgi:hypothetical protein
MLYIHLKSLNSPSIAKDTKKITQRMTIEAHRIIIQPF